MDDRGDERNIDRWFAHYSGDHRDATNQRIHVFAVPLILWSVVALLWCIPVAGHWFRPGIWAALAMFFAWSFYFRASRTGSARSAPTLRTMVSKSMFSSWSPTAALVEGVKIGCRSCSAWRRPSGRAMPLTRPVRW